MKADGSMKSEAGAGVNHVLLQRLLAMAQRYRREGNLWEAMELYWQLAEDHSGTPPANTAKEALMDLAAAYERDKAPHMARSIYERLLVDEAD